MTTDTKKPLAERLLSKMQEEINWQNEDLSEKRNTLVETPNDEARNAVIIAMSVLLALYETQAAMQAEAIRG
jgi:hypothetical protein